MPPPRHLSSHGWGGGSPSWSGGDAGGDPNDERTPCHTSDTCRCPCARGGGGGGTWGGGTPCGTLGKGTT